MTGGAVAFDPGSVLVDGDRIVAVGPVEELDADPRAAGAEIVDVTGHAVLPGLHNCHLHSGLLRGTAESMSLWDWLKAYVDPAHKALTPEIAATASLHCYAESVLAGTTSVMDMWRFMEGSAASRPRPRAAGHARALRGRRGVRLLRDARVEPAAARDAPHRRRRPRAHLGRARAPHLLQRSSASARRSPWWRSSAPGSTRTRRSRSGRWRSR